MSTRNTKARTARKATKTTSRKPASARKATRRKPAAKKSAGKPKATKPAAPAKKRVRDPRLPAPGSTLLREYKGRTINAITYADEKGSPDIVDLFTRARSPSAEGADNG